MRRPVKPFVTEYRSGARRQTGAAGQGAKPDPTRPEAERFEPPSERWPAKPPLPQEDGYEAALRAADALFAARAQRPNAAPSASDPDSPDASAPHPSGGRILRAIDEPPPAELLRLEAEHVPKRRGRKPGSKNKPKLPAPVVAAIEAAADPVAVEPLSLPVAHPVAALAAPSSRDVLLPGAGSRGERYAWVRTRLKPGQQWKRRIPKVAW